MSTPNTTPNLGNVIPSGLARRIVYGTYAVGAVIVGGVAAYYLGIGDALPEQLLGAQGVVAYLGIAVSGLALANTTTAAPPPPAAKGDHAA